MLMVDGYLALVAVLVGYGGVRTERLGLKELEAIQLM